MRYAYENGVEVEFAFVILADGVIRVDTLRWPGFHQAVPQGYAVQILDRLERLPGG